MTNTSLKLGKLVFSLKMLHWSQEKFCGGCLQKIEQEHVITMLSTMWTKTTNNARPRNAEEIRGLR